LDPHSRPIDIHPSDPQKLPIYICPLLDPHNFPNIICPFTPLSFPMDTFSQPDIMNIIPSSKQQLLPIYIF